MTRLFRILFIITMFLVGQPGRLDAQYVDLLWQRIAHYPFQFDATDISGMDNHGIVNEPVLISDRRGSDAEAYSFDGINDYILGGSLSDTITSSVSLSCWIKTGDANRYSHIVSKYNYGVDAGFILGTEEGRILWAGRIGSGIYIRLTSRSNIDDDRWHHVFCMIDDSQWSIYIDGVLESQIDIDYRRTNLNCNVPLTIGMYNQGDNGDHRHFKGAIDEVILYGRPLNDCEIEVLYSGYTMDDR